MADEKIVSRFGGGKKLVMKEIVKDGSTHAIHQKDDTKGEFQKDQLETGRKQQLNLGEMKRKGLR